MSAARSRYFSQLGFFSYSRLLLYVFLILKFIKASRGIVHVTTALFEAIFKFTNGADLDRCINLSHRRRALQDERKTFPT